jgi:hypothetical protein
MAKGLPRYLPTGKPLSADAGKPEEGVTAYDPTFRNDGMFIILDHFNPRDRRNKIHPGLLAEMDYAPVVTHTPTFVPHLLPCTANIGCFPRLPRIFPACMIQLPPDDRSRGGKRRHANLRPFGDETPPNLLQPREPL